MVLTFLNLVVVSGILVGLIQGASDAVKEKYISDLIISPLPDKAYIENSPSVIGIVETTPGIERYSARYRSGGFVEANYKTRREDEKPNTAASQIVGIDPLAEDAVTHLRKNIVEGSFLEPGDYDKVVLGQYLLKQYMPIESPSFSTLEDVGVGSKIRVHVGNAVREVTVKGILKVKVDEISLATYMVDSQLRSLIGRNDGNVTEISILLEPGADPVTVKQAIVRQGVTRFAKVQTFDEGIPKFLKDMIQTFNMLGAGFSSIGLVVASITIFIVIFINALTRRKFIGILKGIGITASAIEVAYVFQSMFYALIGSSIGLLVVYLVLVPIFLAHPIDFPFSDGVLIAPIGQTMFRMGLLVVTTVIAGHNPATKSE
jgi:ABC-type lipoprotein release transport system permease subunit